MQKCGTSYLHRTLGSDLTSLGKEKKQLLFFLSAKFHSPLGTLTVLEKEQKYITKSILSSSLSLTSSACNCCCCLNLFAHIHFYVLNAMLWDSVSLFLKVFQNKFFIQFLAFLLLLLVYRVYIFTHQVYRTYTSIIL